MSPAPEHSASRALPHHSASRSCPGSPVLEADSPNTLTRGLWLRPGSLAPRVLALNPKSQKP